MKKYIKKMHSGVMSLFFGAFLFGSINVIAQNSAVTLDPKLGQITVTNETGIRMNENFILPGQLIKLVIPVSILNQDNAVPKGSCKIKIGLGTKLKLDPTFNLLSVNSSNYFTWSINNVGGQSQLIGDLINDLPTTFNQAEVAFKVVGSQTGKSTITANFLISNHNTNTILSDNDGSNNGSFLKYQITNAAAPTPVTTISDISKIDCSLKVVFGTDMELGLKNYAVELSKDGVNYTNVYQTNASNLANYEAGFSVPTEFQVANLFVRVKSTYLSGEILYSNHKSVSSVCTGKWEISMFPNPVIANGNAVVKAVNGIFNGKYALTLIDLNGKTLKVNQLEFNNALNFNYKTGDLPAGNYLLKVKNADGSQSATLQFVKQ